MAISLSNHIQNIFRVFKFKQERLWVPDLISAGYFGSDIALLGFKGNLFATNYSKHTIVSLGVLLRSSSFAPVTTEALAFRSTTVLLVN